MTIRAVGRISDPYLKRCSTPYNGTGSPKVFAEKLAISRISDRTLPYKEIVPCPKCCKPHVATVIEGSSRVFVSGMATEGIGHRALGITGKFPLLKGAKTVYII